MHAILKSPRRFYISFLHRNPFDYLRTKRKLLFIFQTPFVRQNTPHPKDLKAKAVKLFSRTPEQQPQEKVNEQPTTNGLVKSPPEPVQAVEVIEVNIFNKYK